MRKKKRELTHLNVRTNFTMKSLMSSASAHSPGWVVRTLIVGVASLLHSAAGDCAAGESPRPGAAVHLDFEAKDGVRVHADLYPASRPGTDDPESIKDRPLVLMFHQAASNAGEYETIAPRLVSAGYSCLAVDQRSGGRRWDRNNRTVLGLGRSDDFEAAYADLEAALQWSVDEGWRGPVLVWGSSYSASLVFRLARDHPEIRVVLAFSPGEYFGPGRPVRGWASEVAAAVFATAGNGREVEDARQIVAAVPHGNTTYYVARHGVHGSSTLIAERNPEGVTENWDAVLEFLSARRLLLSRAR